MPDEPMLPPRFDRTLCTPVALAAMVEAITESAIVGELRIRYVLEQRLFAGSSRWAMRLHTTGIDRLTADGLKRAPGTKKGEDGGL